MVVPLIGLGLAAAGAGANWLGQRRGVRAQQAAARQDHTMSMLMSLLDASGQQRAWDRWQADQDEVGGQGSEAYAALVRRLAGHAQQVPGMVAQRADARAQALGPAMDFGEGDAWAQLAGQAQGTAATDAQTRARTQNAGEAFGDLGQLDAQATASGGLGDILRGQELDRRYFGLQRRLAEHERGMGILQQGRQPTQPRMTGAHNAQALGALLNMGGQAAFRWGAYR